MVKVPLTSVHFSPPKGRFYEVTYMTPEGILFRSLPTSYQKARAVWSSLLNQEVFGASMHAIPPKEAYAKLVKEVESIRKQIKERKKRPTIGLGSQEDVDARKQEYLQKLSDLADELEAQARELPVN